MSAKQPTYEESLQKITALEKQINDLNVKIASDDPKNDKEHKEQEAAFKKAMKEHEDETNAKKATMDKVASLFKQAEEEEDPEKKASLMKKAMDEHEKNKEQETAKKGSDHEHDKEHEAKIASLESKLKVGTVNKILTATKIVNPNNYENIAKELKTASIDEVEKKWSELEPFVAAIGLESQATETPKFIPFQASATDGNPDEPIDFSKMSTDKIKEMYR